MYYGYHKLHTRTNNASFVDSCVEQIQTHRHTLRGVRFLDCHELENCVCFAWVCVCLCVCAPQQAARRALSIAHAPTLLLCVLLSVVRWKLRPAIHKTHRAESAHCRTRACLFSIHLSLWYPGLRGLFLLKYILFYAFRVLPKSRIVRQNIIKCVGERSSAEFSCALCRNNEPPSIHNTRNRHPDTR